MLEDQIEVRIDKLEIEENEFLKNVQSIIFCSTAQVQADLQPAQNENTDGQKPSFNLSQTLGELE